MSNHKEQFGFCTFAQNNNDVDYLNLAYTQACNIKDTQKNNRYAVVVDEETNKQIVEKHKRVFDYIIVLKRDYAKEHKNKMSNEWQVFDLTPFKETIKLESDLLFTRSIDHWLPALRLKNILFSYNCKNYTGDLITETPYRKLFKDNKLPNIYTGLYYFRFSQESMKFFKIAKFLWLNWDSVSKELANYGEPVPSTDVVYALAVKLMGEELCTIPSLDFINFVHMKNLIQNWPDAQAWTKYCNVEFDNNMIRINNINQYNPVHYFEKDFVKLRD